MALYKKKGKDLVVEIAGKVDGNGWEPYTAPAVSVAKKEPAEKKGYSENDLYNMSMEKLREIAKSKGIDGPKRKKEFVVAILETQEV